MFYSSSKPSLVPVLFRFSCPFCGEWNLFVQVQGKHDLGMKITSPEFCITFAQTVNELVCLCK